MRLTTTIWEIPNQVLTLMAAFTLVAGDVARFSAAITRRPKPSERYDPKHFHPF